MIFRRRILPGNVSLIFITFCKCLALASLFFLHYSISHADQRNAPSYLKIALVHFDAEHKHPEKNLRQLLALNRKAAEEGASLIFNTEMAVTGYCFKSREDITPFTETDQGQTIQAMGNLAGEFGVYIGITFPERDPSTGSYYNGAFVLGPKGGLISKYHKILTERRWARSGNPLQKGVFDTPWGRIGMVICADSCNGLITRTMALKGVDLLWVPANWPTVGGLDPISIWRARALENGFYIAACNRTGKDLTLDCTHAVSGVFDPEGKPIFTGPSETSRIFMVEIPLDKKGRLANISRPKKMSERNVDLYRQIYLQPWVENLTDFYKLPEAGTLHIHCFVPSSDIMSVSELKNRIEEVQEIRPALWILPEIHENKIKKEELLEIAGKYQVAFAVSLKESDGKPGPFLITPQDIQPFTDSDHTALKMENFPFNILHYGPAALAMVPLEAFKHPELAVVLSKLGSDLVVVSEKKISAEDFLQSRIKSLSGIAVAVCAQNGAEITGVQDVHFSWDQQKQLKPGVCTYSLNTSKTRKKNFYSNIDFDLLLKEK
ncbi:MAG: carbon-nitrogen hydrolase family protein [Desulfobacterales bacterium]|nr:carbon-nitrogen hydrolase family protein [Desulfobacterales bacterium]